MLDECGKTSFTILLCFSTGGNVSKLLELSKELEELLLIQEEFRLPFRQVLPEYRSRFAKTLFDPGIYGFTLVVSLLEALPSVVEVCISRNVHLLNKLADPKLQCTTICFSLKVSARVVLKCF